MGLIKGDNGSLDYSWHDNLRAASWDTVTLLLPDPLEGSEHEIYMYNRYIDPFGGLGCHD